MKKLLSPARLAATFLALSLAGRLSAASDSTAAWYAKIRGTPVFPGTYFEPQTVDTPATPIVNPVPLITSDERQSDVRLHLVVVAIVEPDGRIHTVPHILEEHSIDSMKLRDFKLGVMQALRSCKYRPAMKGGQAVRMVLVLPFDFDPSHPAY